MITENDILRRNKRVVDFFTRSGFSVKLLGDQNCPAIIYNDLFCLSCYVKNFDLIFTDKPKAGAEIFRVKLEAGSFLQRAELMDVLDQAEHRRVFKVKVSSVDLFLSGYNFLDKTKPETRYPVFAKHGAKLYFDEEYARQICEDYNEYDLVVV
ncbi:hypothetical protein C3K47_02915 [Solitalea longa]|uniref:Uncharacterized protein n=1 Tax=Solitalea longa TaxID=2079460 RepID=A0A2S5A742_9SPHI|nr:hypothetical protein [Solitalea longa]POY38365.1 hypothetical protein C3K47_02915 [Solitalea longa]